MTLVGEIVDTKKSAIKTKRITFHLCIFNQNKKNLLSVHPLCLQIQSNKKVNSIKLLCEPCVVMSIETNFISFESKIIELILTQQCISITYKGTFNYLEPNTHQKKKAIILLLTI